MMCAGTAAEKGRKTILIEKNDILGKKLLITGKGRCNVTNLCSDEEFFSNVPTNPKFLYSAYSAFTSVDTMNFFESMGVKLKVERGNRVFPVSDKSGEIADAMRRYIKKHNVNLLKAEAEDIIVEDSMVKGVRLTGKREVYGENVVLATGGMSYRRTGSTGKGYKIAAKYGHDIITPKASLVPLELDNMNECNALRGLSLKNIRIKIIRDNSVVYTDFGEMLFTHFGVSGPVILSASCFARKGDILSIDLKPALDENKLYKRVCADFEKYSNKNYINSLDDLLPKSLIKTVAERTEIQFDKKVNSITKDERLKLVKTLKNLCFTIKCPRPIEEAVITSGGVNIKQINPKTMESRLIKGLFFAGEIIDVDAYTGGFNLQIAFCTAYKAGINI